MPRAARLWGVEGVLLRAAARDEKRDGSECYEALPAATCPPTCHVAT